MKFRKTILFLLFVMLLVASGIPAARAEVGQGDIAPALTVKKMDGSSFDLASLKGKVVLVHFWATWCGPCREEMPQLTAFYLQNKNKGLDMIAMSVDTLRQRSQVKEVGKAFHIPVAMMDEATDGGFGNPEYIPVTYVVDKNGVVQARMMPDQIPLTVDNLNTIVKPLLGGGHS